MSPRGTAFMVLERPAASGSRPTRRAGSRPATRSRTSSARRCGSPAPRALRHSPAWFAWVGTEPALELINEIGVEAIHEHDLGLANRFREGSA